MTFQELTRLFIPSNIKMDSLNTSDVQNRLALSNGGASILDAIQSFFSFPASNAIIDNSHLKDTVTNITYKTTASNSINMSTTTTLADITGLTNVVTAGKKYYFRAVVRYTTSANTVGIKAAVNLPNFPDLKCTFIAPSTAPSSAANGGADKMTLVVTPADLTAATITHTDSNNGDNTFLMEGYVNCTVSGTMAIQAANNGDAGTLTINAGTLTIQEVY